MKRYSSLTSYLAGPPRRTQEQLAHLLGVRQGTVNKWVRGETMPRAEMALKIARITGVTIEGMTRAKANRRAA